MTEPVEISPQLEEWAGRADYALTPGVRTDDGRAVFWASLGEIRLFIGRTDEGWFVITDSDRMGPEHFILAAPSMVTIEKYLLGRFYPAIRSKLNLPRIRVPVAPDELPAGYSIDTRQFEGVGRLALIASDGSTVAVSSTDRVTGTAELVRLSLFSTASNEDIAASALDLDGKPLFRRR